MLLHDQYEAIVAAARRRGSWPNRFFREIDDEILNQRLAVGGGTAWSVSPWERVELIPYPEWRRLALSGPWCVVVHRAGMPELVAWAETEAAAADLADALCNQPWHPTLRQSRAEMSPEAAANLEALVAGANAALNALRRAMAFREDRPLVLPPYGTMLLAVLASARDSVFGALAGLRRDLH